MGAAHIGIGHNDDLVIAQLLHVELVADSRAQGGNDRLELVVADDLVLPGLFHVEHFAPQGQNGLEPGVPALGGGAACGVALDDVDFGQAGVGFVAVPELIGHGRAAQSRLAADGLAGLLGRLPGTGGHHGLFQNGLAHGRVFLQEIGQLLGDDIVHQGPDVGVAQLGLGLALELGVGELDGDHRCQALTHVVAGELVVALNHTGLDGIGV